MGPYRLITQTLTILLWVAYRQYVRSAGMHKKVQVH